MPKKKEQDLTPEEQFNRFKEAAKEHEIEERLPDIEQAFDKLAKPPKEKPAQTPSERSREPK